MLLLVHCFAVVPETAALATTDPSHADCRLVPESSPRESPMMIILAAENSEVDVAVALVETVAIFETGSVVVPLATHPPQANGHSSVHLSSHVLESVAQD
jgi:hypothetical protein